MQIINITTAKAHFSEIVHQVSEGEEIIIERMGRPVVRISRYEPVKEKGRLGLLAGQAVIPDDFDSWPTEEAIALGIVDPEE